MTTRKSIFFTHAHAAASAILSHREGIRATWEALLEASVQDPVAWQAIRSQLDACIVSFAGYLMGEEPACSSMAERWQAMGASRARSADAGVALSLFTETLRRSLADIPGLPFDSSEIVPAAATFTRNVLGRVFPPES